MKDYYANLRANDTLTCYTLIVFKAHLDVGLFHDIQQHTYNHETTISKSTSAKYSW